MQLPDKIRYWVHLLVEFDPITAENRIVKQYVSELKKETKPYEQSDIDDFNLPKTKNIGEVEL